LVEGSSGIPLVEAISFTSSALLVKPDSLIIIV
jgi:hypothetical protein